MLPDIGLLANNMDISKQVASLRSQMAQLKDAIEMDLQNIGYDNLSADLRKRIDNMASIVTSTSEMTEMVASMVKTQYLSADEIKSQYVTTTELTTNYLNASQISSSYASLGWVQALDAIVGTINADYVTANQLSAVDAKFQNLSADNLKSGTISVDRLDVSNMASGMFVGNIMRVGGINIVDSRFSLGGYDCEPISITYLGENGNPKTITVIGCR